MAFLSPTTSSGFSVPLFGGLLLPIVCRSQSNALCQLNCKLYKSICRVGFPRGIDKQRNVKVLAVLQLFFL